MWDKLINEPYRRKIQQALPTLFNMAELETKRGKTVGMEAGNTRERVIIALFMYVYSKDSVEFPPATSHELDVTLLDNPVSIKTKTYKKSNKYDGVKISWTSDWDKLREFLHNYNPQSDLVYINIVWGGDGAFHIIRKETQQQLLHDKGVEWYCKMPTRGTNFRGVPLSQEALGTLVEHADTHRIPITWKRDKSLLVERALYLRWVDLWDTL